MQHMGEEGGSLLSTGDTVDRFEVEILLGQGGIAQVYRVRHRRLGSLHALKLLTIDRRGLADRLILEGQIQAQLRHPNVVAVTDVVEHLGRTGLLMEYVAGQALDHWLASHGAPPVDRGLRMLAQVLSGVAAAHAAGVLHRDLKPANILLSETPLGVVPKVTDFGIAKLFAEDGAPGATRQGAAMGTPGYMAPEQIEDSASVDARADVFALGAIAYELVSGTPALRRQSLIDTFTATAQGDFQRLEPRDDLPDSVIDAIHRALDPKPEARQDSVRQLAEQLFQDFPELSSVVLGGQHGSGLSIRTGGQGGNPTLVRPETSSPSMQTFNLGPDEKPQRADSHGTPAEQPPSTLMPAPGPESPGAPAWVEPTPTPNLGEEVAASQRGRKGWLWLAGLGALAAAIVAAAVLTNPGAPGDEPTAVAPVVAPAPAPATVAANTPAAPALAADPVLESAPPPVATSDSPEPAAAGPATDPVTASAPEAVAEPTPGAAAAPEPGSDEPAAAAEPEPEPEPEPAVADRPGLVGGGLVPAEPEPEPEPVAALEPEPEPEPAAAPPQLRGTWDGRWAGRPLRLVVKGQSGDKLIGEIEIFVGSTYRTFSVSGQVDVATGRIRFWETGGSELVLQGMVTGESMSGTLTRKGQRKPQPWNATLTRGAF